MRIALIALLLAGCAGLPPTPDKGELSCTSVGGIYAADGRCLAGRV